MTSRRPPLSARAEEGAITVLAAAVISLVVSVSLAITAAAGVLVERHRLGGAADAAALAAADAASGIEPGVPCEAAAAISTANAARLEQCLIEGNIADVEVSSAVGPFTVRAAARAGQAPSLRSVRTGASKK